MFSVSGDGPTGGRRDTGAVIISPNGLDETAAPVESIRLIHNE